MTWNNLNSLISQHTRFCITSHLSLDGDCVGSQLAFAWYLESIGKKPCMYNHDPVPGKFMFMRHADRISTQRPRGPVEVLVVLDCSNKGRLGWDTADFDGVPVINIDHHRDNGVFGTVNIVDTHASATGELLYRFFIDHGVDFPPHVAEALYVAILTDTGGFRFPNTTSSILGIGSDLARRGADPAAVYERIYASHSRTALLLQSRIWSTLDFHLDGKVCSMELPMTLFDELGAVYSDSEGMADYTITAADVEVGLLAKHNESETHFSLRSKGAVDVGKIASQIKDGGGHSSAAGCTMKAPFAQALKEMLAIIARELG
ncbi:MAG: bifunctional oligoribonuclease/PAP phosphatase NrnA [Chitinispirillaceae bacterium]|nr:bifunctional oligoribonuclease/PAP phosphatase NrnA [Chitinispirillaceae bacterium]